MVPIELTILGVEVEVAGLSSSEEPTGAMTTIPPLSSSLEPA